MDWPGLVGLVSKSSGTKRNAESEKRGLTQRAKRQADHWLRWGAVRWGGGRGAGVAWGVGYRGIRWSGAKQNEIKWGVGKMGCSEVAQKEVM